MNYMDENPLKTKENGFVKDSEIKIKMSAKHWVTILLVGILTAVGAFAVYGWDYILATQIFLLCSLMTYLSFVDLELHLAPDWATFAILILCLPTAIRYVAIHQYMGLVNMLIGGAVCFLPLAFGTVLTKGGIGGADVKIMTAVGLFLGSGGAFIALIFGLAYSIIITLILAALKKADIKGKLAMLPYFTMSMITAIIFPQIAKTIFPFL